MKFKKRLLTSRSKPNGSFWMPIRRLPMMGMFRSPIHMSQGVGMSAVGVLNVLVNGPNGPDTPWLMRIADWAKSHLNKYRKFSYIAPSNRKRRIRGSVPSRSLPISGAELNGIARREPRRIKNELPPGVELKNPVRRREPEAVVDELPPKPPDSRL